MIKVDMNYNNQDRRDEHMREEADTSSKYCIVNKKRARCNDNHYELHQEQKEQLQDPNYNHIDIHRERYFDDEYYRSSDQKAIEQRSTAVVMNSHHIFNERSATQSKAMLRHPEHSEFLPYRSRHRYEDDDCDNTAVTPVSLIDLSTQSIKKQDKEILDPERSQTAKNETSYLPRQWMDAYIRKPIHTNQASASQVNCEQQSISSARLPSMTSISTGGTKQPDLASLPLTRSATTAKGSATKKNLKKKYTRSGVWTDEEKKFAAAMICCYRNGTLILDDNMTLRQYICQKLDCHPMRVTKKLSRLLGGIGHTKNAATAQVASETEMEKARLLLHNLEEAFIKKNQEEINQVTRLTSAFHSRLFEE